MLYQGLADKSCSVVLLLYQILKLQSRMKYFVYIILIVTMVIMFDFCSGDRFPVPPRKCVIMVIASAYLLTGDQKIHRPTGQNENVM